MHTTSDPDRHARGCAEPGATNPNARLLTPGEINALGLEMEHAVAAMTYSQVCELIDMAVHDPTAAIVAQVYTIVMRHAPRAAVAAHIANDVPLDRAQCDEGAYAAPIGARPSLQIVH